MKQIKLFLTDVDGCLTDGGMYYSASGDEMKKFCVYDGMGMVMLRKKGISCGILTSETTDIVVNRAKKLKLDHLFMGVGRQFETLPVLHFSPAGSEPAQLPQLTKKEACEMICKEMGISLENVCYIGDDINDLDILQAVGMPACPQNAVKEVKSVADILQLSKNGGEGAVRELCDYILSISK